MPERFLLQVLRNLVNHGILGSTRGVEGGYTLERSPAELSLLDVIEAVDGPFDSSLLSHEGLPEDSRTKLECVMKKITELARRELHATKLSHLMPVFQAQVVEPVLAPAGSGAAEMDLSCRRLPPTSSPDST